MTVKELIDILNNVDDKSREIFARNDHGNFEVCLDVFDMDDGVYIDEYFNGPEKSE